jgi:hypothetical protein
VRRPNRLQRDCAGDVRARYTWRADAVMEAVRYEAAVAVARANGFATGEMMKTRQSGGTSGGSRGPRGRSPAAEEPPASRVRLAGWVIWSAAR